MAQETVYPFAKKENGEVPPRAHGLAKSNEEQGEGYTEDWASCDSGAPPQ